MQLQQQPYLSDDDKWEIKNQSERIDKKKFYIYESNDEIRMVNLIVNFKNHTIFI